MCVSVWVWVWVCGTSLTRKLDCELQLVCSVHLNYLSVDSTLKSWFASRALVLTTCVKHIMLGSALPLLY